MQTELNTVEILMFQRQVEKETAKEIDKLSTKLGDEDVCETKKRQSFK